MKRKRWRPLGVLLAACLMLAGCAHSGDTNGTAPEDPVRITVWTYYNGKQLTAFSQLVSEFNSTVGREQGIFVECCGHGSVTDLENNMLEAAQGKVGAGELPDIVAAYSDTAYTLEQMGLAADLTPYLTREELDSFVEEYIQEGDLLGDGSIRIFPVAKSTEVFILNDTDWQEFARATGAVYQDFSTVEGLVSVAEAYYNWTDSLTPEPNDGKAFFGRDSMANYLLVGGMQLGTEIFQTREGQLTLNFDKETLRRLWDNYYVPYVKGYFTESGRFRSDDMKTGELIAFVGSSAGATFFPEQVIVSDTESYPIQLKAFQSPVFAGGEAYAAQQGAGMVVVAGEARQEQASVEFLKWMVQSRNSIRFSARAGYLPVTKDSVLEGVLSGEDCTPLMSDVLTTAAETVRASSMYTPGAFPNATGARRILEDAMSQAARTDRAAVEACLAAGESLEQAVKPYVGQERFDLWYNETLGELEKLTG